MDNLTQDTMGKDSHTLVPMGDNPWYAVRVFSHKQQLIDEHLKGKGFKTFIPMTYEDVLDTEQHIRHVLRPVVHNLLFVEKTMDEKTMRNIINNMPYEISVIRKNREQPSYYEIPAKQMQEFKLMCNPELWVSKFIDEETVKLKAGTQVNVKFGPLKGLSGKLVRQSKKYYLLKEVPGMGVMLKVSRWCCVPMS